MRRMVLLIGLLACQSHEGPPPPVSNLGPGAGGAGSGPAGAPAAGSPSERGGVLSRGTDDTASRAAPAPAAANPEALAQDQRILDVLATQLDVTVRLASTVADRGGPASAWARGEADDAARLQEQLLSLRAAWYGSGELPTPAATPSLDELAPRTDDVAAQQGPNASRAPVTAQPVPATPGASEPTKLPPEPGDASERLPQGRRIDVGKPGIVDQAPPPKTRRPDPAVAPDTVDAAVHRLEAGTPSPALVREILAPMLQRSISAAMIGASQAAHPELRQLSLRIQASEQKALDALTQLPQG